MTTYNFFKAIDNLFVVARDESLLLVPGREEYISLSDWLLNRDRGRYICMSNSIIAKRIKITIFIIIDHCHMSVRNLIS